MQDSLVSQLKNSAWDEISKAVSDGLALVSQQKLSDVLTVVTGPVTISTWQSAAEVKAAGGFRHVRPSVNKMAFDYVYRFPLNYDELRSPGSDSIKKWATAARAYELRHVLGCLAKESVRHECGPEDLFSAPVGGWGQLRCLAFKDPDSLGVIRIPESVDKAARDGLIRVDVATPLDRIRALLFRLGGGPYVQRSADLTLDWIPGPLMGADLVLAGQLELFNATKATVTGIRLARKEEHSAGSAGGDQAGLVGKDDELGPVTRP